MASASHIQCKYASVRVMTVDGDWFSLSPHGNTVDISYSGDDCETTAYGDDTHVNLAGLKNYTITFNGWWAGSGEAAPASLLDDLVGASVGTEIQINPAGSVATSPAYAGSVNISSIDVGFPVDNIATMNFTATPRHGALTMVADGSW